MSGTPQNPFDEVIGDFVRNSAAEVLKELKDSLVGKKKPKKRDKQLKNANSGATVVEVIMSGLQYRTKRDDLEKAMHKISKSPVFYDLAEYEILETKIVDQWLVIFHFSFLSPLPPAEAYYETDVALNQEANEYSLLGYKVEVHGK